MKISIILTNGQRLEREYASKTSALKILAGLDLKLPHQVILCKVDNAYRSLTHVVTRDCEIEYLDMTNNYAWLCYQASLVFLFRVAAKQVIGKDIFAVTNSLNKGLFIKVKGTIGEEQIRLIEGKMQEMVKEKLPIVKKHSNSHDVMNLLNSSGDKSRLKLFDSFSDLRDVEVFELANERELFYDLLVPDTSYLAKFELLPYRKGLLLRYPHISDPERIPEYEDQKLIYDTFSEATRWGHLMGVDYVADLNAKIRNNDYKDMILMQEALFEKKISDIADEIKEAGKRIILICGPSSSGKTSLANRLCIQLKVLGLKPLYLGTDDYFLEREETPILPNGEKDYESIRAIDLKLFNQQMNDLLAGREVDLPTFDFIDGHKKYGKRITSISSNQPIVIEGIHALNELLTSDIADSEKFKIYISPLTSLNIDSYNRIPTTDARMLRRMVRDYRSRGRSAEVTIADWPKVRAGEDINIFPYYNKADVLFNTNYIYELAILKKKAEPLLKQVGRDKKEYGEAQRLLSFLRFFEPLEDDSLIANNSILREFIGGSVFVD